MGSNKYLKSVIQASVLSSINAFIFLVVLNEVFPDLNRIWIFIFLLFAISIPLCIKLKH